MKIVCYFLKTSKLLLIISLKNLTYFTDIIRFFNRNYFNKFGCGAWI
jgi:hypothetical protein